MSYPSRRAGRSADSHAAAGASNPCELADDRIERVGPFAPIAGEEMLPAEKEAHEVLRADGLDFLCAGAGPCSDGCARAARDRTIPACAWRRERAATSRCPWPRARASAISMSARGNAQRDRDGLAASSVPGLRAGERTISTSAAPASMSSRNSSGPRWAASVPRAQTAPAIAASARQRPRLARRVRPPASIGADDTQRVARPCRASSSRKAGQAALAATSAAVTNARPSSASCISSALVGFGHASSRTRSIAAESRRPSVGRRCLGRASAAPSPPASGAPRAARRRGTRRAAPSGSRARAARARQDRARRPRRRRPRCRAAGAPARRCPSPRAGSRAPSGAPADGRGSRASPAMFSAQAIWSGNTAAIRSSARMRCSGAGTFLPPRKRGSASDVPAFQRQRAANIGASSSAWTRTSRTVFECR